MQKISGNEVSKKIIVRLKREPKPKKEFAAVLVGEDPVSLNFLKEKGKTAAVLGVKFKIYKLSDRLSETALKKAVSEIAKKKSVGGVIVQLPLPAKYDRHEVLNAVPQSKDPDVLSELSIGAFYNGHSPVLPPSVATTEEILRFAGVDLSKSDIAVVGLGLLIGRPIATWLTNKCRNLYLIGRESDISQVKKADVVVSGTGVPGLVTSAMLKSGAGVIDFGYAYLGGSPRGDFDAGKSAKKLKFYTPTPGGTGPVLVAKLFENFYNLNK